MLSIPSGAVPHALHGFSDVRALGFPVRSPRRSWSPWAWMSKWPGTRAPLGGAMLQMLLGPGARNGFGAAFGFPCKPTEICFHFATRGCVTRTLKTRIFSLPGLDLESYQMFLLPPFFPPGLPEVFAFAFRRWRTCSTSLMPTGATTSRRRAICCRVHEPPGALKPKRHTFKASNRKQTHSTWSIHTYLPDVIEVYLSIQVPENLGTLKTVAVLCIASEAIQQEGLPRKTHRQK